MTLRACQGGVGMAQLHFAGLRLLGRVLGLGQQHYAENLTRAFVINAPSFFDLGDSRTLPFVSKHSTAVQCRTLSDSAFLCRALWNQMP